MNDKTRTVAACALFLLLGFSVFGLGLMVTPQPSPIAVIEQTPIPSTKPLYIVKLHGDRLAVFTPDKPNTPMKITDVRASSLRHFDREQLKHGIEVNSHEALLLLLEDFSS